MEGKSTVAAFKLVDNEETRKQWDHAFELLLTIVVSDNELVLRLTVRNTGSTDFEFAALLHSYFRVQSIHAASVHGYSGMTYCDKMRNAEKVCMIWIHSQLTLAR